jgi:lactate dehydrogenase-like 2-hydroxyacid dehydrogenase
VDSRALIDALKSLETLWYAGIDVYEDEAGIFFENLSSEIIHQTKANKISLIFYQVKREVFCLDLYK